MAVLASGKGVSVLEERVFEGRFATAEALKSMGADIRIQDRMAIIRGIYPLKGASVKAADLRGGAALVVGALAAEGETRIGGCTHIQRGYEDICRDLAALGAEIRWREQEQAE